MGSVGDRVVGVVNGPNTAQDSVLLLERGVFRKKFNTGTKMEMR